MPVEIKELVIRAVVEPRPQTPAPQVEPVQPQWSDSDQEAIVAACVKEVLRTLQRSRER